jgi:hypothetical protein
MRKTKSKTITVADVEDRDIVLPIRFGVDDLLLYVQLHNHMVDTGMSKAFIVRESLKYYFALMKKYAIVRRKGLK